MLASAWARFFIYSFFLLLCGACVYRWRWARSSDAARRVALIASVGLFAGVLFRAWAYTYAAFGLEDSLSRESLSVIVVDSRWGGRWQYQLLASVLALTGCALAYAHRTAGLLVSSIATLAFAAALPFTGHAVTSPWTLVSQTAHLVGASVWLGTLAVLTMLREQDETYRELAPVAVSGAALVVASGIVTATSYLPSFSSLWMSTYGRVLAFKLAVALCILVLGFLNWRKFRGASGRSWVGVEAAAAFLVLALTGWLTGIDTP